MAGGYPPAAPSVSLVPDEDDAGKAALRRRFRAERAARPPARRDADADGLRDVVLARVVGLRRVACYCSTSTEPGTAPLLETLRDAGLAVLLPVVAGDVLDWALDDGRRRTGLRGVPEPVGPLLGPDALGGCDLTLVPALAADTTGGRLGQGGGHYDRALAASRPDGPVAAVVHDDELLEGAVLPVLPHDVRVDAVVTPTRWVWTTVPPPTPHS